jgi:periplasmic nitrate reductase NapD
VADEIHLCSLVVHGRPEALGSVGAGIALIPGAEIQAVSAEGKLVVTLETGSEGEILRCLGLISELHGVLAATLVFHHCEPVGAPDLEQE